MSVIFIIFANIKVKMNIEVLLNKKIEEKKQGQVLSLEKKHNFKKKMYIESYGCQMNFSDSEIVASILAKEGFGTTKDIAEADLVLVNTCSIREKAELTTRKRLEFYQSIKKKKNPKMIVGVLGCMAERLKENFWKKKN